MCLFRPVRAYLLVLALLAPLALPSASGAQAPAAIAGIARDSSGAVLRGVTVDASSPAAPPRLVTLSLQLGF